MPDDGREERRQAAVEPRVDQQRRAPLADRAELGQRDLGEVEGQRDRLAVEVAAADDPAAAGRDRASSAHAAAGEDERVVGGRVELDVEDAAEVVERVADRAVDLRDAAQRVRVLDLVGVAVVAGLELAVAQQVAQLARRPRPGRGAAGRAGTPRRTRRPSRAAPRRSSPRRRWPSGRAGPRRPGASAPMAPIIWVPLRSARPSLASSVSGSRPASRRATQRRHPTDPPSSTSPRPMSGSARWASGARSPDAPTLPCSGTTGWMPAAGSRAAGRRRAAGSRCGRARACSPGAGASPGRPRAGTPARRPPRGSSAGSAGAGPRPGRRIDTSRPGPEPGRHAVDDGALGDERLDDVARLLHPRPGRGRRASPRRRGGRPPRHRRSSGRRRSGRSVPVTAVRVDSAGPPVHHRPRIVGYAPARPPGS